MSKPNRRTARLALAGLAVPAILLGVAGQASAAEITPIAQYVDSTVSDTEHELGAVLDDLGLSAE